MDDIDLLLDHYIIVRKDGTPVLNGKPEEFEKVLRELIVNRQQAYARWYHNRLIGIGNPHEIYERNHRVD